MRVLALHNRYQQRGGEDVVFDTEVAQLRAAGHEVLAHTWDNLAIASLSDTLSRALASRWSAASYAEVKGLVGRFRPDVAHVHNWFPQLSASGVAAAVDAGVACVQTLHNFRSICANALLYRDGLPCTDCVGRSKLPGLVHRCYRGGLGASAAVTVSSGRMKRLWHERGERIQLIALTEFAKRTFVEDGVAADRIVVKPNSTADLGAGPSQRDGGILFVGRLSHEKGAALLPEIAAGLSAPLEVIGDGPLLAKIASRAPPNLVLRGRQPANVVAEAMRRASVLVLPSQCFEGFPMAVAEAYCAGLPVAAPDIGAFPDLVGAVGAGALVSGGVADWTLALDRMLANPERLRGYGVAGRAYYEQRLSPQANVEQLLAIYERAIAG